MYVEKLDTGNSENRDPLYVLLCKQLSDTYVHLGTIRYEDGKACNTQCALICSFEDFTVNANKVFSTASICFRLLEVL